MAWCIVMISVAFSSPADIHLELQQAYSMRTRYESTTTNQKTLVAAIMNQTSMPGSHDVTTVKGILIG
jgi:hypothetical protein